MAVSQSLSVTEVSGSVNTTANTSQVRILWQSTQTGDSWNGYTRTAKYYVSINGGAETEYSVNYTLPQNSTKTIVDTTITINHRNDGSGSVSVRTWMDTSISAGVVQKSKTLNLTTIPRASTITSASNRTLGNTCIVKWTPLSASFRYKLKFTLGSFSYTTGAIHPNTTALYTYDKYTLDIASIAPQITTSPPTATMAVTLYTYSDSGATAQVGSASSTTFTVTVPDNSSTKPTVTMTLTPVTPYEKFASLYLQGRSKVKADFSESRGNYGASIKSNAMQIDGVSYLSPYESGVLRKSGTVTIVGTATDSRGFTNTTPKSINVIAYEAPYIEPSEGYKKVICERCTQNGTASDTGTYLHIKGSRNYTKINTNGIVNTCSVRCRYKPEGGKWSHDSGKGVDVLLSTNTSTDEFDVILPNIVSNIAISYTVELNITDDTNLPSTMIFDIPSENVDFELREGGKGAAFGKHATTANLLDVAWDAKFNEVTHFNSLYLIEHEITVGGDKDTYYPVHINPDTAYRIINTQPAFLGLGKTLGSTTPDWDGNHNTANTSSISAAWLFRYMGWDGNGNNIIPLYKKEEYAKILAHIQGLGTAASGVVLYLRGGGAAYKIVCSIPFTAMVYLAETNISNASNPETSPVIVSPRGYEGNYGIELSNGIVSDFVTEQGQTGIWNYRKWHSGRAECWGTASITTNFTTAWGNLYICSAISRKNYPFAFAARPTETATIRADGAACFGYAWSGGVGLNTNAQTAQYGAARPVEISEQSTVYIDYHVSGRWK